MVAAAGSLSYGRMPTSSSSLLQVEAVRAASACAHEDCTLSMSCGAGKTITALWLVACEWRCRCLVLVHTQALQNQWIEQASRLIPAARVGALGGTRKAKRDGRAEDAELGRHDVVVAMVQSISRRPWSAEQRAELSRYALIVDECHHTPATTFSAAVELSSCRRRLGLSATPKRADSLDLRHWLGEVVFEYTRPQSVRFSQPVAPRVSIPEGVTAVERINALAVCPARTQWVADLVAAEVRRGEGRVLVLAQRVQILQDLLELIKGKAAVVCGSTRPAERERALSEANPVLASLQVAKEGLDMADCTGLVYALPPGVDKGLVAQTVGRVTRSPDVQARVVDPVDREPSVMASQAVTRRRMWLKAGYERVEPDASPPGANAGEGDSSSERDLCSLWGAGQLPLR